MKGKYIAYFCALSLCACQSNTVLQAPIAQQNTSLTQSASQKSSPDIKTTTNIKEVELPENLSKAVENNEPEKPPEPKYTVEFRYSGKYPSGLTGEKTDELDNYYVNVSGLDKFVSPDSLAVTYQFSHQVWVDDKGKVLNELPQSLPEKWTINVYHANDDSKKHGFPVASDVHTGEFASITWNGVTSEGRLAPNGKYVMEFVPEGFKFKPISNIMELSNFPQPTGDIPAPDYVADELMVKFKDLESAKKKYTVTSTNDNGWSTVKASGFKISSTSSDSQQIQDELNALAQAIANDTNVSTAEPNLIFNTLFTPDDPQLGQQYGLNKVKAYNAWDIKQGEDSVTVAIVDTGIDPNHPDLAANLVPGFNALSNNTNTTDDHGHGTHVAGIAAGIGNNASGIAGLGFGCKMMPIKVLGANGSGSTSAVANGIIWAADNGADVINMSLGGSMGTTVMADAIEYAVSKGSVVIAAMGNDAGNVQNFPAAYATSIPSLIAVGSTDNADQRSYFSNYGNWITVAAPGSSIMSTLPGYSVQMNPSGGHYGLANGTSMATPFVAGLAALLKSQNSNYSPAQIKQAIQDGADDLGSPGFDTHFGHGRINAWKTLNLQLPEPEPTPTPGPEPSEPPAGTTSGVGGLSFDVSSL